jgi:two-component system cell cycle sensor histidine kinase/response regulator CckA
LTNTANKKDNQFFEAFSRSLFNCQTSIGLMATDHSGIINEFNSGAEVITGYTAAEVIGKKTPLFFHTESDLKKLKCNLSKDLNSNGTFLKIVCSMKTGLEFAASEWSYLMKNGSVHTIKLNINLISNRMGGIIGSVIIMQDLTDRTKEKEELELKLLQSQKLEAIGTLAGGIAHDFNNVLMGIQGNLSLLKMNSEHSNSQLKYLRSIESCVKSATNLTKQLLNFARLGINEIKMVNLNHLLKNCVFMLGRIRKEIRLNIKFQHNVWLTEADENQIEQVFLNLFVNACQAMPEGGELTLKTENVILCKLEVLAFQAIPGKYVKVMIKDTGIGMDDSVKNKIFDPFFTTKKKEKGTGLGLASVYGILKKHKGFIDVESCLGKGTIFNLYLPAIENETEKGITQHQMQNKNKVILLVDDEEMILDTSSEMLENLGYKVLKTRSGKEAISIFNKFMHKINLLMLDLIIPDMNGVKVYEEIAKIKPDVKVLFTIGLDLKNTTIKRENKKSIDFIQKPFDLNALAQKTKKILSIK